MSRDLSASDVESLGNVMRRLEELQSEHPSLWIRYVALADGPDGDDVVVLVWNDEEGEFSASVSS